MRLRIRYSKKGKVRFISHRDVARIWERALRRVGVAVAVAVAVVIAIVVTAEAAEAAVTIGRPFRI